MSLTLIIGAGRSALGSLKLLKRLGQSCRVSDISAQHAAEHEAIRKEGGELIVGPQDEQLLKGVSQIVVSPGLLPDIPILVAARRRGLPIKSEIDLALEHFSGQVIGVTGTNGKSTTTSLIAHMLQQLGFKAEASGNIGIPPSLLLATGPAPAILVLELSSYQLDFSQAIANRVSLFMSFSEDHMERHRTMQNYFAAKWRLLNATAGDGLIIAPRAVLEWAQQFAPSPPLAPVAQILIDEEAPLDLYAGPHVYLDTKTGIIRGDGIRGQRQLPHDLSLHNQLNVLAAILAVQMIQKTPWDRCLDTLASFHWLPYRFEEIGTCRGYPVYNDSKSTNVESTLVALRSLKVPGIVLLGGYPKGEAFHAIAAHRDRIQTLIAFGQAGPRIAQDLADLHPEVFPTLQAALEHLPTLIAGTPAPILLSPACSSFDEFKNFEERGSYFNQIIGPLLD